MNGTTVEIEPEQIVATIAADGGVWIEYRPYPNAVRQRCRLNKTQFERLLRAYEQAAKRAAA